jgi:hypothetical protein
MTIPGLTHRPPPRPQSRIGHLNRHNGDSPTRQLPVPDGQPLAMATIGKTKTNGFN